MIRLLMFMCIIQPCYYAFADNSVNPLYLPGYSYPPVPVQPQQPPLPDILLRNGPFLIDPATGNTLMPNGNSGYVDPRTGDTYRQIMPHSVIEQGTGKIIQIQ